MVSISDPCGCSLTRATVSPLTLDRIEAMGMIEYNHEAIFARMMESRAVGVVPNSLHDLITSRMVKVDKGELHEKKVDRTSIIAPFKFRKRERNWASTYFRITAGTANAHAGTTHGGIVYPSSAWDLTVDVGGTARVIPGSALQNLSRYFLPGNYINVETVTLAGAAVTVYLKIITSTDASSTVATVTVAAPYTAAGWAALGGTTQALFNPTNGLVTLLTNNVSDYESWCHNQAWNNSTEVIVDWFQTSRFSRCTNKEYEEMLARVLRGEVNGFQRTFKYIDVVKRNKQMRDEYNKQLMQTFFFGGRISEYQVDDLAAVNFTNLEQVVDPEDNSCVYEYKAGAVGMYTQMKENSRVVDMQGAALDLDALFELCYTVKRHRQLDGKPHDIIDLMTDRKTKDNIDQIMIRYLKGRYGYDITRYVQKGTVIDEATGGPAFEYTVYDVPKESFRIAVFTHPFFDDRVDAFSDVGTAGASLSTRGRLLMVIDWNNWAMGIVETNSVHREYKNDVTAQANSTWSCVMKINTKFYDLESTTFDIECGDLSRDLIVENFSDACPVLTNIPCNYSTGTTGSTGSTG